MLAIRLRRARAPHELGLLEALSDDDVCDGELPAGQCSRLVENNRL